MASTPPSSNDVNLPHAQDLLRITSVHQGVCRLFCYWGCYDLNNCELAWLSHQSRDSKLEIKDVKIVNSGEIALTGARYQGFTSSSKPFLITATQASEANDGTGRVDMQQPRATITMRNGQVIKLRSKLASLTGQMMWLTWPGMLSSPNQQKI